MLNENARTIIKHSILTLNLITVWFLFQSCNPISVKDEKSLNVLQSSNGGDIYGGKVYALPLPNDETCLDNNKNKNVIVQNLKGEYSLVRDNCSNLASPLKIEKDSIVQIDLTSIEYKSERYVQQYAGAVDGGLLGDSAKWCRGQALQQIEGKSETVFIEFVEQQDGHFKGQISWLIEKPSNSTYYSSSAIKLFYVDAGPNKIGLRGVDLSVGFSGLNAEAVISEISSSHVATLNVDSNEIDVNLNCYNF